MWGEGGLYKKVCGNQEFVGGEGEEGEEQGEGGGCGHDVAMSIIYICVRLHEVRGVIITLL